MEKSELQEIIKTCREKLKPLGLRKADDQIPQLSWVLFLKCLDDFEKRRELEKHYKPIITKPHRWRDWATDPVKGLSGDDLLNFILSELFPALRNLPAEKGLEQRATVNSIFASINNRIQNGYKLREIINEINKINFTNTQIVRTFAEVYEDLIIEMRNDAARRAVFYTPKAVVQFIVNQIKPNFKKGEKVFDPACGMGGFLIESFNYMKKDEKSTPDLIKLRYHTLYGTEKEGEYYLCAVMNMLLHDLDKPNLLKDNSLSKDTKLITEKDQYHVIMTNPTYGGPEDKSVKKNLPYVMQGASSEMHFLYLVTESLREGGRGAIIMPNGVLFDSDKAAGEIKGNLLKKCNLHTIIRLPTSMFEPYTGIQTNILFFEKKGPTKEIWYYDMPIRTGIKGYSKTKSPILEDFEPVVEWMKNKKENDNAWLVKVTDIKDYNLDIKNPNVKEEKVDLSPHELISQIISDEKKTLNLLEDVEKLIQKEIPK